MTQTRTISNAAASRKAISTVMSLIGVYGGTAAENFGTTSGKAKHQLDITLRTSTLAITLRANAIYLNNPFNIINVPDHWADLDVLAVVIPTRPDQEVSDVKVLFIPKHIFAGKQSLYISELYKMLWAGAEALMAIARGEIDKHTAITVAACNAVVKRAPSKRAAGKVIKQTVADATQAKQQLINFDYVPEPDMPDTSALG